MDENHAYAVYVLPDLLRSTQRFFILSEMAFFCAADIFQRGLRLRVVAGAWP